MPLILSTWRPSPSRGSFSGETHDLHRFLSTRQRKVVPGCPVASMKRKTGRRFLVLKLGPKVTWVSGAT